LAAAGKFVVVREVPADWHCHSALYGHFLLIQTVVAVPAVQDADVPQPQSTALGLYSSSYRRTKAEQQHLYSSCDEKNESEINYDNHFPSVIV